MGADGVILSFLAAARGPDFILYGQRIDPEVPLHADSGGEFTGVET